MKPIHQNKVVLITGGGKGIGRATAIAFVRAGAKVAICGRQKADLDQTQAYLENIGGDCFAIPGDVTKIDECQRIISQVVAHYGRLDILINNAGMSMRGSFQTTQLEVFHQIMAVNFSGAVNMTHIALPYLLKHQGSVVFVSSISGLRGLPNLAPYSSGKMALTALSESLRAETRSQHLHVGIVYVGFTENDQKKTILDGQGNPIKILRPKHHATQAQVGRAILTMTHKRQKIKVLTPLGHLAGWAFRYFPRLSGYLLETFATKSRMYR
jgi:NAD(P)-dependent dehydrogenase (short-subunit alcohol dehydrogenase family)